jgi:hypothetical protein
MQDVRGAAGAVCAAAVEGGEERRRQGADGGPLVTVFSGNRYPGGQGGRRPMALMP